MERLNVLRIDASARRDESESRALSDFALDRLAKRRKLTLVERDLRGPLPHIDQAWISAAYTEPGQRDAAQQSALQLSEALIEELEQSDLLVLSTPVYNFSVPASLKAWIDLVARAGRTFRYTANGPEGLLKGKRALVVITSGGTRVGSDIDFAGRYLEHLLGFLGIDEVTIAAADGRMQDSDLARRRAANAIERWLADVAAADGARSIPVSTKRQLEEVSRV